MSRSKPGVRAERVSIVGNGPFKILLGEIGPAPPVVCIGRARSLQYLGVISDGTVEIALSL